MMLCWRFTKRGAKEKVDVSLTELPNRSIRGDEAQESGGNELAEPAELADPGETTLLSNPNVVDTPNLSVESQEDHGEKGAGEMQSEELELLPKHNIFLSHSGAQKPFVEQLCVDLENAGYFPFFDRRSDSLPKGEKFAELILQAAEQCRVAVVVLSMDYLESKWPMLELIKFTRERRYYRPNLKILPVFYKIGVNDLKSEHDRIMSVWRERAERDTRLNLKDFDYALRLLSGINGEVFEGVSEVAYRKAIVASVCRLYPPDVQFDVSAMQGRDRLCEVVVAELDNLYTEGKHARIVGVHGMGGSGKTLLCKALCNIYHSEFAGRVLHVELCNGYKDSSKLQENIISAQNLILEVLTDAGPLLLRSVANIDQGNSSLFDRLGTRDVFVAIDNVVEESKEWVQVLLHYLSPRSKAIVTSRSLENLKNLFEFKPVTVPLRSWVDFSSDENSSIASIPREKISCIQVPGVDKDEALKIFLHHALSPTRLPSTFTFQELEVLETCIKRCFFPIKDQSVEASDSRHMSGHYHPLSLQALGSYLKGIDPREPLQWIQKSKILHEQRFRLHKHSIFDILRAGYDALPSQQDQLMFLDIAVFAPRRKLHNLHDLCNWLSAVHGVDQETTLHKMKNLLRKSLVQDWESNKTSKVTVHDLYVEFAEQQIHSEELQRWCVYETEGRTLPSCLKSSPPGLRWSSFVRLRLQTVSIIKFPHEKLLEWANLVVLDINLVQHKSLDISPLRCLRSLKLKSFILETLTWSDDMEELRYVKLSCERLVQEPNFSSCSNLLELNMRLANAAVCEERRDSIRPLLLGTLAHTLKVLQLICCIPKLPEILVLEDLRNLEVLEIVNDIGFYGDEGSCAIANLSVLTQLRRLVLKNLPIKGSLPGLELLVGLEYLVLNRCRALDSLSGLGKLTNLQVLDASATAIQELRGLERLLELRGLYLVNCISLKSLPDLLPLASLKEFFFFDCPKLSWKAPRVTESCIVVNRADFHDNDIGDLWADFVRRFSEWSNQKSYSGIPVNFQLILDLCPAPEFYERWSSTAPGEFSELIDAFQAAFRIMHNMASAGRTKQEFDPETDLIICSKIVSVMPKYVDSVYVRMMMKGAWNLSSYVDHLRNLMKSHRVHVEVRPD